MGKLESLIAKAQRLSSEQGSNLAVCSEVGGDGIERFWLWKEEWLKAAIEREIDYIKTHEEDAENPFARFRVHWSAGNVQEILESLQVVRDKAETKFVNVR